MTPNNRKFIGHLIIDKVQDLLPKLKFSDNFNFFIKDEYYNYPFHMKKFNENQIIDLTLFLSKIPQEKMISVLISIIYQSYDFKKYVLGLTGRICFYKKAQV